MDFRLLRHLSYFKIVADERHFGKAAKRLGISQPPLSQQIKILERNLGVQLFERSRSGVFLTNEAQQILPAVERLLAEGTQLEAAVMEARAGRIQRISIGAIAYIMSEILPSILVKARSHMSNLSVYIKEVDSSEALAALEEEEIDVAFLRAEDDIGDVRVEPLTREQLVLGVPRDHALASEDRISLADLSKEPMVLCPRRVSPAYFDRILNICRGGGLTPRVVFEARSITSQLAFIACGGAIGLVPEGVIDPEHRSVRFIPLKEDAEIVTSAVAWNVRNRNTALEEFLDHVLKNSPRLSPSQHT